MVKDELTSGTGCAVGSCSFTSLAIGVTDDTLLFLIEIFVGGTRSATGV